MRFWVSRSDSFCTLSAGNSRHNVYLRRLSVSKQVFQGFYQTGTCCQHRICHDERSSLYIRASKVILFNGKIIVHIVFSIRCHKTAVCLIKIVQNSLKQWNSSSQNRSNHRLNSDFFHLDFIQRRGDFHLFVIQFFTNFKGCDFAYSFHISTEFHSIGLNFYISQFIYPRINQRNLVRKYMHHNCLIFSILLKISPSLYKRKRTKTIFV